MVNGDVTLLQGTRMRASRGETFWHQTLNGGYVAYYWRWTWTALGNNSCWASRCRRNTLNKCTRHLPVFWHVEGRNAHGPRLRTTSLEVSTHRQYPRIERTKAAVQKSGLAKPADQQDSASHHTDSGCGLKLVAGRT